MTLKHLLDVRTDEPRTLGESVYQKLRDSIVSNRLKPETRLNEKEIAEAFHVSRTPVREALVRLSAEGYVHMLSHRESLVRGVSAEEIADIFEAMRILDEFAVDALVRKFSRETLAEVKAKTERMERSYRSGRHAAYLKINGDIHRTLWRELPNRYIRGELERCLLQVERSLYSMDPDLKQGPGFEESLAHHQALSLLLEAGDRSGLRRLIRKHWTPPLP